MVLRAGTAFAAKAQATTGNGEFDSDIAPLKTKGTTSVSAYSQQNGDVNKTITANVTLGGVDQTVGNTSPLPTYGTGNTAPKIGTLGPVYGILDRSSGITYKLDKADLTKAGDTYAIYSKTGNYNGEGSTLVQVDGERNLFAFAIGGGQPGAAAGRATDPFPIPSGEYAYNPTLSGSVEVDAPGETADIHALAMDSFVAPLSDVDNYPDNGAPDSEALWTLTMDATSLTSSPGVVSVDFELNPSALGEISFSPGFLTTIGPYSDSASEAAAIDVAADQFINSQLVEDGGGAAVDLNSLDIFPAGTMYTVGADGVDYLDEVDAGVTGVPEPSAAWIAIGLLGLMGLTARPRKSVNACRQL